MAITTSIIAGVATTGYSIYAQNKAAKNATKVQQAALASRPDANTDTLKANQAALDAQASQRRKASGTQGRQSTILTGPSGIQNAPPPATKTLLGL